MTYRTAPSSPVLVVAFGGQVFGLDPTSGRRLWEHKGREKLVHHVRIIVLNERVYAALSSDLDVLDYTTGRLLSRTTIPNGTCSTFTLMEGRIYAAGGGSVACFSLDGALLWSDNFPGKGNAVVALAVPGYSVQGDT